MTDFTQSLRDRFARSEGGPLGLLREAAFARFAKLGLPTTQDEDWKYTSLAPLAQMRFEPAPEATVRDIGRWTLGDGAIRLVFVNGRYRPELSSRAPGGAFAGSLAVALAERPELVERELARHATIRAMR